MKQKIKEFLKRKLHLVEKQEFDVAEAVAKRGVSGWVDFDYETFKKEILAYIELQRMEGFAYKFAAHQTTPVLYASVYAVMIKGLLGELDKLTREEKQAWGDYINSFQREADGLYYDPNLAGDAFEHIGTWGEGWGKHHLIAHVIIALKRLGVKPKFELKYLAPFYDEEYLVKWMEGFEFGEKVWTESNYFMNLYSVLEYARDELDDAKAGKSVEVMKAWLLKKQRPETGMWHARDYATLTPLMKLFVVRSAYHFYPLFEYEGDKITHAEKIVDAILPLQNSLGGWTVEGWNSGACEDIDAMEPLMRLYKEVDSERQKKIAAALRRTMPWIFAARCNDGGFSFYVRSAQEYGGHQLTSSKRDESSMFATWFRLLTIAYATKVLGVETGFDIGRFPGYEISL